LLAEALRSAGARVQYRGQDINEQALLSTRRRFESFPDAQVAVGDTLLIDGFGDFHADLVIVDAPWGMSWRSSATAVEARRQTGSFGFGLPQQSDSSWLFISLALEKLRPPDQGGGRVAALVAPSALTAGGATGVVRQRIVEAGLLESVTRLPERLAPNTSIALYLLTFTNNADSAGRGDVAIADLQTQFTTSRHRRSVPASAFWELESGLRTRKSGPRNRTIDVVQLHRREAMVSRQSGDGNRLSWQLTTYGNVPIDDQLLQSRYGDNSGIVVDSPPVSVIDLDPSHFFADKTQDVLKEISGKGWASRRLSQLLSKEPEGPDGSPSAIDGDLFLPMSGRGEVSTEPPDPDFAGMVMSIHIDGDVVEPAYLAAWFNSDQGHSSRLRTTGERNAQVHGRSALRPGPKPWMRWADQLIIPVPPRGTQLALASTDEQLGSYRAELSRQRKRIWIDPDGVAEVLSRLGNVFDESVSTWLEQLPFPIASALWTAETAISPGDQQRAYVHAWEAIVTFHATVLLSAARCDPGSSSEIEATIRRTLREQNLGIERASFGTWVVIAEKTSKELRRMLESNDTDNIALIRNAFAGLSQLGIERLVSKDVVAKFNEINTKRNRWSGHTGYTSEDEWQTQVASFVSELTNLRQLLGDVWSQLLLVRAGSAKRTRDGYVQKAEVAVGTRSPFRTQDFSVGEAMIDGELYLVRDGSESPLRLGQFVQLQAAPRNAQYTTYFYNRTEGASVRMVSYQHGPASEIQTDVDNFRDEFGELTS
jgi:hypothetical protein